MDPQLAADFRTGNRYYAACAAALTGCGRSEDRADLTDAEQARWRKQALECPCATLAVRGRILDANPASREAVRRRAPSWRGPC